MMTVNREKTLPTALRILRENGGAIRAPHGPQEGREAPGMFSLKSESRSTRPGQDRRRAGQPFPLLACSCPRSWNFLGYPGANRSHFCAVPYPYPAGVYVSRKSERQRFLVLHANDGFHAHGVEEQRLAAILMMRANQRMDTRRR
jgi:hypothetical protein